MKPPALQPTVASLQQLLSDTAGQTNPTVESVRQQAQAAEFPYPELAAQVFRFLQTRPSGAGGTLSTDDISDAFMALLMDPEAVEALGGGKSTNPWLSVRSALRNTGVNLGNALMDVYAMVRETGLGYVPTVLQLAKDLEGILAQLAKSGAGEDLGALAKLLEQAGLPAWMASLAGVWFRRRKKGALAPTDQDLEELFTDPEVLEELAQTDGPWEVYQHQAEALRTLRHFGQSFVALADATEK